MDDNVRVRALSDAVHEMLWLKPTVAVVGAFAVGAGLSTVTWDGGPLGGVMFVGDAEAARGVLQLLVGTTLTVTATVFSIMVVALQLASTQFSPRSLRSYVRDPGTQRALAVLMAAVAYGVAVLLRTSDGRPEAPALAVSVGVLGLLPVLAALVYLIHHIAQSVRIEQLMRLITADTSAAIARNHPERWEGDTPADPAAGAPPEPPAHAVGIPACVSGYLQEVDAGGLAEVARTHDLTIMLRQLVGGHCVEALPIAWAWHPDGRTLTDRDRQQVARDCGHVVQIGFERTMNEDIAFGLRQLVDIALRAMSPGINDPRTAIEATEHLAQLLCPLAGRRLDPDIVRDPDGQLRAVVPRPSFAGYLVLACGQLRRFAAREPAVMVGLLVMLEQVALATTAQHRRVTIAEQADLVVAAAEREVSEPDDMGPVRRQAAAVHQALQGAVPQRSQAPVP